ncbi:MAG: Eco57I restriction-modification methylase domain-containing protein [Candidatus Heimdallarchaeaceae archaeon]
MNLVNEYFLHQVETDIQVIQEKLDKSLVSNGRKKTGSYYTPDFVAQYIVEKAISQSLLNKLNKLVSKRLFKDFNELKRKQDSAIFSILFNKILPNFTICDIAMGWGVFLLHSFDYLFSLYKTTFSVLEDEIQRNSSLEDFTERDIEKFIIDSIISNNLYGTDLSSVSTELAKLKFAEKALKLLKEKQIILPTFNFRVGNSLIGLPFEQRTENCSSFSNYRKSVLNGIPSSNREEVNMWLGNETQLNWNHIFPEVSKMGGFDVVIGNPPYINVKRMNLSGRKAYSKLYSTYNPNGDISNVFWERGLDLCNSEGIVSFITPRITYY